MRIYKGAKIEEINIAIIEALELETGKEVFTLRVTQEEENDLETIIVFTDKSVLLAIINVLDADGELGVRVRGNWI